MSFRTPIGRVRGLGSAKEGTHHWWAQRVTAVALVPLTLWFVFAMASMAGSNHAAVSAWIGDPRNAILLILLVVATFHHVHLGVQVVIEDYVHGEGVKIVSLMAVKLGCAGLAVASIFSILKVAL